jgi:flagellar hook-length control protein FliK
VSTSALAGGSEAAPAAQAATGSDPTALSTTVPGNELATAMLVPGASRAAAANGAPALELPLTATPGSPQFSHELGERLLWLVREGVHEARLQLNPRDLGPIEVRLGISDGAAQVSFSAQHAGTAAAVQQSLPQLREMLAQQGLQLGQAEVSQQQPGAGQHTPQQERSAAGDARGPAGRGVDEPVVGERVRVIGRGLVDAYA